MYTQELQSSALSLLLKTPNGRHGVGYNRSALRYSYLCYSCLLARKSGALRIIVRFSIPLTLTCANSFHTLLLRTGRSGF